MVLGGRGRDAKSRDHWPDPARHRRVKSLVAVMAATLHQENPHTHTRTLLRADTAYLTEESARTKLIHYSAEESDTSEVMEAFHILDPVPAKRRSTSSDKMISEHEENVSHDLMLVCQASSDPPFLEVERRWAVRSTEN